MATEPRRHIFNNEAGYSLQLRIEVARTASLQSLLGLLGANLVLSSASRV